MDSLVEINCQLFSRPQESEAGAGWMHRPLCSPITRRSVSDDTVTQPRCPGKENAPVSLRALLPTWHAPPIEGLQPEEFLMGLLALGILPSSWEAQEGSEGISRAACQEN